MLEVGECRVIRRGSSIQIAKIAGIPIRLDVSFLVSFVLISAIFGLRILPSMVNPDPTGVTVVGLSILAGLIFFASLLLHELAHSITARLYGLTVANITLFLLGGVSQITEESKSASQEFVIAIVGPLTSAALGGLFFALYYLTGSGNSPLAAVIQWLGFINLTLAIFNMLPGFPLDGGRVFRAMIWGVTRSRTRATRYAARVGQLVGAALAIGGVAILVIDIGDGTGGLNGLWLIMIGGFLYNAAAQSHAIAAAEERLGNVTVRDVMSTRLRTVQSDTSVRGLAPARDRIDHGAAYLVSDNETVVGILTGAQIALLDEQSYLSSTVGDVMIDAGSIASIGPSASGQEALERLREAKTTILPVVENGRLLGLIGLEQMLIALRGPSAPTPAT